jgi:hypothetical protein
VRQTQLGEGLATTHEKEKTSMIEVLSLIRGELAIFFACITCL